MTAVPPSIAVILPLESTAATVDLDEIHSMVLFSVVSGGSTVAVSVSSVPLIRINSVLSRVRVEMDIPTVTSQIAESFPSPVVAVMVAVPTFSAVILPLPSTNTTSLLLVAHITVLSVASSGPTVAVSVLLAPLSILKASELILIVDAGTKTVTMQAAVFPFEVVAVIVAVPPPTAVICPMLSTVAILALPVDHLMLLSPDALEGVIVGVNTADMSPLFKVS